VVGRLVVGWVGGLAGWQVGWWVGGCGYGERTNVSGTYTDLNHAHRSHIVGRKSGSRAAHCEKREDEIGSTPVALLVPSLLGALHLVELGRSRSSWHRDSASAGNPDYWP
jgi:hypothetical protein